MPDLKLVKAEQQEYPGVDDFIAEVGLDFINRSTPLTLIRLAFLAGRVFECKADVARFKAMNSPTLKNQAE